MWLDYYLVGPILVLIRRNDLEFTLDDSVARRAGMPWHVCRSTLLRQFPAIPPHANTQYSRHHQYDTTQSDSGNNAEHDESTNREDTDNNDQQVGNRITDRKLSI